MLGQSCRLTRRLTALANYIHTSTYIQVCVYMSFLGWCEPLPDKGHLNPYLFNGSFPRLRVDNLGRASSLGSSKPAHNLLNEAAKSD